VGPTDSMLIGLTWAEAVARFGILEGEDIALGFQSRDTWTARAALWPVRNTRLGVPVEMAGMPVAENGVHGGFRGYGIARIERAVPHPGTAAKALAEDRLPEPEPAYEQFGPAVRRALDQDAAARQKTTASAGRINPLPLREGIISLSTAGPIAAAIPTQEIAPDHKPALSSAEREAFREIARALAQSTTESADKPGPDARKLARPGEAGPPEDTQAALEWPRPSESSQPLSHPDEPVRAGSLQALKKALSKRARLNFETPEMPEAGGAKPPSPVISYDTLQARREQRGRAEAAQAPWALIVERLPIGLLVQQNGVIVFANRYLLDLTGYGDFESFQSNISAEKLFVSDGPSPAGDIHRFGIATRSGDTLQADVALQATSWNDAPATLTTIRRVGDASAGPQYKALELDLLSARAEVRELQSVLDTATDGIIALDGEGRILSLNRSAEALFGFDQNEITGESLTVLLEPESHVAALDYLEGLKSNGVQSIMNDGRDVKGRERNGGVLPLFMTIGRVGEGQRASRFCVVLRDITHWKKVEADLTDAKRAAEDSSAHKTDFLAKVSHEIRTPLNAIIGFSQVMMTESFGPIGNERYRQYVKDINASGEHVVSLVNDLLDLSKVASGKLELSFGSVDVNTIVAGCVAMIQPQANANKVIVRSQLGAHLPMVVADERSIRQIVLNLLSNAAKFTEPGGQVIASTSFTDSGEVIIRVRDTGIGMAEEEVRRAMEPFRQIPGPRSSGGTGLGLPLTKALVEANRAGFSLHSEPRKGTLAEVTFPSTRVLAE
jgi:PAS domain S-box-containing protein